MTRGQQLQGFPPGDVDYVAVERFVAGRPVGRDLFPNERVAVARILRGRGGSSTEVAKLLGVNGTVAKQLWDAAV